MTQISMWLILYHSTSLCRKVLGNCLLALPQVCLGSQGQHFTSVYLRLFMKTSECGVDPLPECWQLKSPELQEFKTITVNGSSQAERKSQPVNRAAYNETSHPHWKGWGRKISKVKLHLYSFFLYPNSKHLLSELLRNGLWMENKQSDVR